jgi:hypothetical protein
VTVPMDDEDEDEDEDEFGAIKTNTELGIS